MTRNIVLFVSFWAILLTGQGGHALDIEKARIHNQQAIELFNTGKYRESIHEFQEAYKNNPNPLILFNIAKVYEKLGEDERAVEQYRRYLSEAGHPDDEAFVTSKIALLEERLAILNSKVTVTSEPSRVFVFIDKKEKSMLHVTPFTRWLSIGPHLLLIHCEGYAPQEKTILLERGKPLNVTITLTKSLLQGSITIMGSLPDAEVFINGSFVGITPIKERKLKVGNHKVAVKKPGYHAWERVVTVKSEEPLIVKAELLPIKAELIQQQESRGATSLELPSWITIGVGGAFAVVGVVVNVLAVNEAQDANRLVKSDTETWDSFLMRYNDAYDTAETMAYTSYAAYAIGGAGIVTGLILLLVDEQEPVTSWQLSPIFTEDEARLSFRQRF